MKRLEIEWRHFERDGETCLRCAATGKTLRQVMAELGQELGTKGVKVSFRETKLPASRLAESNAILFNGVQLEELLAGATSGTSDCLSCACLVGRETAVSVADKSQDKARIESETTNRTAQPLRIRLSRSIACKWCNVRFFLVIVRAAQPLPSDASPV